jgi:peptidoglycan/LPS O-acetylase OafA/YrhL
MDDTRAYAVAAASGAALWILTAVVSGRGEAWDSSLYWTVAYPAAIVVAGILGYRSPKRAWRWGLTVMLVQAVVLAVTSASFGLLPLGLILFGVLALPAIGSAALCARLRARA